MFKSKHYNVMIFAAPTWVIYVLRGEEQMYASQFINSETPNYQYLSLRVYQLTETPGGGVASPCAKVEALYSVYSTV